MSLGSSQLIQIFFAFKIVQKETIIHKKAVEPHDHSALSFIGGRKS